MARYVVMQRDEASSVDAIVAAQIVRDGFVILGFLFPPLWLLWHRLWFEAVLAFAGLLCAAVLGEAMGFPLVASALSLLVSIFVGLEGQAMLVAALARRGWSESGVIEADSLADAEIRYVAAAMDTRPGAPVEESVPVQSYPASRPLQAPALGLLGYPGRS